jgi:hypothetical protein
MAKEFSASAPFAFTRTCREAATCESEAARRKRSKTSAKSEPPGAPSRVVSVCAGWPGSARTTRMSPPEAGEKNTAPPETSCGVCAGMRTTSVRAAPAGPARARPASIVTSAVPVQVRMPDICRIAAAVGLSTANDSSSSTTFLRFCGSNLTVTVSPTAGTRPPGSSSVRVVL